MTVRLLLKKGNQILEYHDFPVLLMQGTHTYSFNFTVNHLTMPDIYLIGCQIIYLDEIVKTKNTTIEITAYRNPVVVTEKYTSLLGQTVYVHAINNGTEDVNNFTAVQSISLLEGLLIYHTSPDAQRSQYSISWFAGDLLPGEIKTYTYNITFVPLILMPFIVALIAFLIFIWTRKMVVIKNIVGHSMGEGAMEIKVKLQVQNISRTPFFNVNITEFLPAITSAVAGFEALDGKLHVKGADKRIKWHIDEIRPDEQVIITYRMKSEIHIIGSVILPPTYITFESESGRTYERSSNTVELRTITSVPESQ
jgi:hypothetical protein